MIQSTPSRTHEEFFLTNRCTLSSWHIYFFLLIIPATFFHSEFLCSLSSPSSGIFQGVLPCGLHFSRSTHFSTQIWFPFLPLYRNNSLPRSPQVAMPFSKGHHAVLNRCDLSAIEHYRPHLLSWNTLYQLNSMTVHAYCFSLI